MNRRRADAAAALLVGSVLVGGGVLSWRVYRQRQALDGSMGSMMDVSMSSMHGINPLWPLLGTLLVASVVGGLYLLVREDLAASTGTARTESVDRDSTPDDASEEPDEEPSSAGSINPEANPRARVLDLLPDDERRVLDPVIESPGVTQIELRDRSKFSKSKVSQTVSALEERGLLYREKQGRTYRIYPSEDLRTRDS